MRFILLVELSFDKYKALYVENQHQKRLANGF